MTSISHFVVIPLKLVVWLKDDLLRLHVVEDIVTFQGFAHRHDLVGHEAVQCISVNLCVSLSCTNLLKFVLVLLQYFQRLVKDACVDLLSASLSALTR